MYECFYLTMLISPILAGIISVVFAVIGKPLTKIWRYIMYGLMAITIVSFIGVAVTLREVS